MVKSDSQLRATSEISGPVYLLGSEVFNSPHSYRLRGPTDG